MGVECLELVVAFSEFVCDFCAEGLEDGVVAFEFASEISAEFGVRAGQKG